MKYTSALPEVVVRLLDYRRRFANLGFSSNLAFSREWRVALETSLVELLPRHTLPALECVVDVGANEGSWSIGIARLTGAKQIRAYEPNPEIFKLLQQNTQPFSEIRCINSAVGESIGDLTLNVHEMHQLSSVLQITEESLANHGISASRSRKITVPSTTLDHDLTDVDEISLLKLDVQGFEPKVLAGARSVLRRTRILMTEITYSSYYDGDLQFSAYYDAITSLGNFKLWVISKPNISKDGKPLWADAVFVQET